MIFKIHKSLIKNILYTYCISNITIHTFIISVKKGKQGIWNNFSVTLCMETFREIYNGAHTLYWTAITTKSMVPLRVIWFVFYSERCLISLNVKLSFILINTLFSGRRYRGERAYNFWEVYLPNLVEQVNAVNSTMIRMNHLQYIRLYSY